MSDRLKEKVALITGAARGQGKAEAELFAKEGATVYATDVLGDEVEEVVAGIRDDSGEAMAHTHDVTEEDEWEALVNTVMDEQEALDILVNNAGIISEETITEETIDMWEHTLAVNQRGVWLGMKHSIPAMLEGDGGSIINISSIWGVDGYPGAAAYQSTKGAVRILTKNAAVTYAADGIRTNSVHPGFIKTPMTEELDEIEEAVVRDTPQGRAGYPEDVAPCVLFLASDEAAYVNGAELYVDGGYLAE